MEVGNAKGIALREHSGEDRAVLELGGGCGPAAAALAGLCQSEATPPRFMSPVCGCGMRLQSLLLQSSRF